MDFEVQNVSVYSTEYYDTPQAVLDEANYHVDIILDEICGRSDYLHYDGNNDETIIELFKSWMRQIAFSLNNFENRKLVSLEDHDITVYFWSNEVKSRFVPRKKE